VTQTSDSLPLDRDVGLSARRSNAMTSSDLQVAGAEDDDVRDAFRAAMRAFTGTVTLITTRTEHGEWRGMAATAVTSISMEPPTCLVCVNRETTFYPAVMASRQFYINTMHRDHHALMSSFTKPECRGARFQSGPWRLGRNSIPLLENAQSNIFCEMFDSFAVGTHDVIFGRVIDVTLRPDHDPLLYGNGNYLRQADVLTDIR
jgi:flavin reductase